MNFIAHILAVYIMVLSVLPCSDVHTAPDPFSGSRYEITQQEHGNETDYCGPFCTCSCCGGIIFKQRIPGSLIKELALNTEDTQQSPSIYRDPFISGVYTKIWQPPKI